MAIRHSFILIFFFLNPFANGNSDGKPSKNKKDSAIQLKSAFFIDDVHCIGLVNTETGLNSDYLNIRRCEESLAYYGIKKFHWITRTDLEFASFYMNRSKGIRRVRIVTKSSELPNHVHVFAHFQKLPDFKAILRQSATYQNGQGNTAPRWEGWLQWETLDQRYAHFGSASLGILAKRSFAHDPIEVSDLEKGMEYDEEDILALQEKDATYIDLYYKGNNLTWMFEFHLIDSNTRSQKLADLDVQFIFGYRHQNRSNTLLQYAIPSAIVSTYNYHNEFGDKKTREISFVGLQLKPDFDSYETTDAYASLEWYTSTGDDHHSFYKGELYKVFGELFGLHSLGSDQLFVRNAILPQHQFRTKNYDEWSIYYRMTQRIQGESAMLNIEVGHQSFASIQSDDDDSLELQSAYLGLGYIRDSDDQRIDLSLIYQPQRTW